MSNDFPFLVVISQVIPHSKSAGPIQMMRLLEHWPVDRLVVYGPPIPDGAETIACKYNRFRPYIERLQFTRFARQIGFLGLLARPEPRNVVLPHRTVILSVMQSSLHFRAAARIARRNCLPLALIIHDDPEA